MMAVLNYYATYKTAVDSNQITCTCQEMTFDNNGDEVNAGVHIFLGIFGHSNSVEATTKESKCAVISR